MPFDLRLLNEGGPRRPFTAARSPRWPTLLHAPRYGALAATTRTATISITVNYTGFAVNSDLIARARVKRMGKRIASLSVEIADASDALIADALVTYKIA